MNKIHRLDSALPCLADKFNVEVDHECQMKAMEISYRDVEDMQSCFYFFLAKKTGKKKEERKRTTKFWIKGLVILCQKWELEVKVR